MGFLNNLWDYISLTVKNKKHGKTSEKYYSSNPNDGIYYIFNDKDSKTDEKINKKL
jgi:hypothetical protein